MIKYKLLDDGTGVILTRQPLLFPGEDLSIQFEGASVGAVAIFESGEKDYYRDIVDGMCVAPAYKFDRSVRVTVVAVDGSIAPSRWACEGLLIDRLPDGSALVCPNDMNLPGEVVRLRLENQQLWEGQAMLNQRLDELNRRLDRIMEGYNLT